MGLPVAVYLAPDPPGGGSSTLSRRLSRHPAMRSRPPLRGELRSALTARGCRGFVRLRKVAPGDERIGVCATALYGGVSWV